MKIFINEKFLEISDEKIHIINESGSLGDALAWIPIVDQFAIEKKSKVNIYTPFKNLFIGKYPLLNFYHYYEKDIIIKNNNEKKYSLGCFDKGNKTINLQQIACDILEIKYKEIIPKINFPPKIQNKINKKYVCIATQSTSQCKYWNNPNGWQQVVDYLKSLDYEVVCIDRHENFGIPSHMNSIPKNCINKTGDLPLEDRINDLIHCDFFIGLSSGLSWLAWSCKKPVIMISGFTDTHNEFYTPYRVINKNVCNSCWNDPNNKFEPSNWLWCPRNKDFECSRQISFEMVKGKIDQCIKDLNISS